MPLTIEIKDHHTNRNPAYRGSHTIDLCRLEGDTEGKCGRGQVLVTSTTIVGMKPRSHTIYCGVTYRSAVLSSEARL